MPKSNHTQPKQTKHVTGEVINNVLIGKDGNLFLHELTTSFHFIVKTVDHTIVERKPYRTSEIGDHLPKTRHPLFARCRTLQTINSQREYPLSI